MESTDDFGVGGVFSDYADYLIKEAEVKDEMRVAIREIEAMGRDIHSVLQRVHRPGGVKDTAAISELVGQRLTKVRELYQILDSKVPVGSYWKYSQLWSNINSWLAFLVTFTLYIQEEKLAPKQKVSELLGLESLTTLHLDIEEYLHGLCHLSNELSRFAVNAVTSEDYHRPVRIGEFLNSLNVGFRMLNLKNDALRKKFDSIKYDLKKVEEVVYDLSIRGLNKPAVAPVVPPPAAVTAE